MTKKQLESALSEFTKPIELVFKPWGDKEELKILGFEVEIQELDEHHRHYDDCPFELHGYSFQGERVISCHGYTSDDSKEQFCKVLMDKIKTELGVSLNITYKKD